MCAIVGCTHSFGRPQLGHAMESTDMGFPHASQGMSKAEAASDAVAKLVIGCTSRRIAVRPERSRTCRRGRPSPRRTGRSLRVRTGETLPTTQVLFHPAPGFCLIGQSFVAVSAVFGVWSDGGIPVRSLGVTTPPVSSKIRNSSFRRGMTRPSTMRLTVAVVVPIWTANSVKVTWLWRRNSESFMNYVLR